MDIREAGLPARAVNALTKAGIDNLDDIKKMKDAEIMATRAVGRKTVEQIRARLAELRDAKTSVDVASVNSRESDWVRNHRNLVRAIMDGEVVITSK